MLWSLNQAKVKGKGKEKRLERSLCEPLRALLTIKQKDIKIKTARCAVQQAV
jgi:hypothetical protein